MKKISFDSNGWLIGKIPKQCVIDCSHSGECVHDVDRWIDKLKFEVPRVLAIKYLQTFGAWPIESEEKDKGLNQMTDRELAQKVLWTACCAINEGQGWDGLND